MFRSLFRVCRGNIKKTLRYPSLSVPRYISVTHSFSDKSVTSNTEVKLEDVPAVANKEQNEKETGIFNPFAVMDLCLEKFDDDLLYFPEVLDLDQWTAIVDHGYCIESMALNYKQLLSTGRMSDDIREKLASFKLFKLAVPKKYGGLEYSETEISYLHELLSAYPSVQRILSDNEDFGIKALVKFGTEEQKQKYLPKLANGESIVTLAFLDEASSSFDMKSLMSLEVIAIDDKFLLNGKKCWVPNAASADAFIVFGTQTVEDNEGLLPLNTVFIVDRNTEGVRVHKPREKKWFSGLEICEVTFDDVSVRNECILGGYGKGSDVLKGIIGQSRTKAVVECCSAMKRVLHDAIDICANNEFNKKLLITYGYVENILGEMSTLVYAVESLAYYLNARFDYFDNHPSLMIDCFIAKIFAYQTLQEMLQLYFNVTGKYGYKSGSIVEEIVQNAPFYSVLDEPAFEMKLFVISECLQYAANHLATQIKHAKLPYSYPIETWKQMIKFSKHEDDNAKPKLDISMCLNNSLAVIADDIEYCISRLSFCTEKHLYRHGRDALKQDLDIIHLCDILVQIYVMIACTARAHKELSTSRNAINSRLLAGAFSYRSVAKIKNISSLLGRNSEELDTYAEIGRKVFQDKKYPAEHPLMRNF